MKPEVHNIEHLTAQAHGLYLRLRDRMDSNGDLAPTVEHAYNRYQRRVERLTSRKAVTLH
jgi:hypothetical protein